MRLRKKPWGLNELNTNNLFIKNPEENKGKWQLFFNNNNPIHIEVGAGKGEFASKMSILTPNINYIAIERQTNVIVSALKKAREHNCKGNLAFFVADASDLLKYFNNDKIERIYINFCDPWPNKKKWAKRRLTHKNFLAIYESIFNKKGELFFKTDNKALFEFSLNEISDKGWRLHNISLDLHNSLNKDYKGDVKTEYEQKFLAQNMPIYRLEAYYENNL